MRMLRHWGIAAAALLAAVAGAGSAAAQTAPVDPMTLVDPELRPIVEKGIPSGIKFDAATLPAMRKAMGAAAKSPEERMIPGPAGAPEVRILLVAPPSASKARPAILHIHGGGYIIGSASIAPDLRQLAKEIDAVIVSVDYRLAPETKFPGSLEDNYAALQWLYDHAAELGVDRNRIALIGESAGGGHAAALAIAARDRGQIPIAFQALIYPMLDDRTGSSRAVPAHIGTILWTREANRFGWTALLGVPAGSKAVPRGSVPARVANLAGLPPTWIGVGALDLFVEEDVAFAGRLVAAGVPTELLVVPGAFHGFNLFGAQTRVARQFNDAWIDALKRALAR